MLQGKVGAAIKWISQVRGGICKLTPEVIVDLENKHPEAASPNEETLEKLLKEPLSKPETIIFHELDEGSIEKNNKRISWAFWDG